MIVPDEPAVCLIALEVTVVSVQCGQSTTVGRRRTIVVSCWAV